MMDRSVLLERADLLIEHRRYELAILELTRLLSEYPELSEAQTRLALCYMPLQRFDDAIKAARKAVSLDPENPVNHSILATVYMSADEKRSALLSIKQAIEIDPSVATFFSLRSAIELSLGWPTDAQYSAETGLSLNPSSVDCRIRLAEAHQAQNNFSKANQVLADALKLNPEYFRAHLDKGITLLLSREVVPACEHFKEALRLDPDSEEAKLGMVTAVRLKNPVVYNIGCIVGKFSLFGTWPIFALLFAVGILVNCISPSQHPHAQSLFLVWLFLIWLMTYLRTAGEISTDLTIAFDEHVKYIISPKQRRAVLVSSALLILSVSALVCGALSELQTLLLVGTSIVFMIAPVRDFISSKTTPANSLIRIGLISFIGLYIGIVLQPWTLRSMLNDIPIVTWMVLLVWFVNSDVFDIINKKLFRTFSESPKV
jgi:tetratricopeptide (TPR) repeat protein